MAHVVQAGAAAVTAVVDLGNGLRQVTRVLDDSLQLGSIHDHMDREMNMLLALMEDHQQKVQIHVTKTSSRIHIEWVRSVGDIKAQVEELSERYMHESNGSQVFNAVSRSELSREMRKKYADILDLWEKGNQIGDRLLVDKEAERVVKIEGAPKIQGFPTLQKPLQNILDLLKNKKVKGIGVHGCVGYGKTAIMQNLNNNEKVEEMFDIVIWVKVSTEDGQKISSTEHLQKVIIQRLKLVMDGVYHVGEVAKIIRKKLESIKFLILLDDVKEDLDLDEVGIPRTNVGSKIVLATRIKLYHSFVDRWIQVQKLTDKEAGKMFQAILGQNPQIKTLMRKLVKLGDGVPLMINMVARCFGMKKTDEDWADEFYKLRHWPRKGDDVMQELYDVLNFCYGSLNDAQKDCYHFSALYPEDGEIYCGGLLDGWWGENLLGGVYDDAKDVYVKARDTLQHLKTMLFLQEGMNNQYVRMDKWIRKAALYTMKGPNHLIRTSEALKEPPKEEHWREKKWISLGDNHLCYLPNNPYCSELSTLFLQENLDLREIPVPFFERMQKLRVLGLYGTGILSLPPSLSNLSSLKVLNLNGCAELEVFPVQIVELKHLEVLDIRCSGLSNIPPAIQSSIRLRRLLASFTCSTNATNTQDGVIPQISTLQELIFDVRFSKNRWKEMLNDVLKNLTTLRKLTNLQFCFQDEYIDVIKKMADDTFKISAPKADHLNTFVKTRDELKSTSFQLFVGCSITADPQIQEISEYQTYVKYCNGEDRNVSILELLPNADALEIVDHVDLVDLGILESSSIRGCLIQSCPRIRTIVDCNYTLHNLERLYLDNLPELLRIWDGALQRESLPKLITLHIARCPELIEIFPQKLVEWKLITLHIARCPKLIEIFPQKVVEGVIQASHNAGQQSCVFPKLEKIMLIDMPNLTSVSGNDTLEWPSLEEVRIIKCPKLDNVNLNAKELKEVRIINCPKLDNLKDELKVDYKDDVAEEELQQYCTFAAEGGL